MEKLQRQHKGCVLVQIKSNAKRTICIIHLCVGAKTHEQKIYPIENKPENFREWIDARSTHLRCKQI